MDFSIVSLFVLLGSSSVYNEHCVQGATDRMITKFTCITPETEHARQFIMTYIIEPFFEEYGVSFDVIIGTGYESALGHVGINAHYGYASAAWSVRDSTSKKKVFVNVPLVDLNRLEKLIAVYGSDLKRELLTDQDAKELDRIFFTIRHELGHGLMAQISWFSILNLFPYKAVIASLVAGLAGYGCLRKHSNWSEMDAVGTAVPLVFIVAFVAELSCYYVEEMNADWYGAGTNANIIQAAVRFFEQQDTFAIHKNIEKNSAPEWAKNVRAVIVGKHPRNKQRRAHVLARLPKIGQLDVDSSVAIVA